MLDDNEDIDDKCNNHNNEEKYNNLSYDDDYNNHNDHDKNNNLNNSAEVPKVQNHNDFCYNDDNDKMNKKAVGAPMAKRS